MFQHTTDQHGDATPGTPPDPAKADGDSGHSTVQRDRHRRPQENHDDQPTLPGSPGGTTRLRRHPRIAHGARCSGRLTLLRPLRWPIGETPYYCRRAFKLIPFTTLRDIFNSNYTVNLTPTPLSQSTLDLLDLGLTFIPTSRLLDPITTRTDFKYISRRVRLIDYFHFHGSSEETDNIDFRKKFTSRSSWTPQDRQISTATLNTLDKLCNITNNCLAGKLVKIKETTYIKNKVRANISPAQIRTIRELKNNKNIIIRPADKGSSVVVMRTEAYRTEALRQLNNDNYYRPLANALYPETAKKIYFALNYLKTKNQRTKL